MKLKTIKITLCEACLEGRGGECHTPGCALWLHDAPEPGIDARNYEVLEEWPDELADYLASKTP